MIKTEFEWHDVNEWKPSPARTKGDWDYTDDVFVQDAAGNNGVASYSRKRNEEGVWSGHLVVAYWAYIPKNPFRNEK